MNEYVQGQLTTYMYIYELCMCIVQHIYNNGNPFWIQDEGIRCLLQTLLYINIRYRNCVFHICTWPKAMFVITAYEPVGRTPMPTLVRAEGYIQ